MSTLFATTVVNAKPQDRDYKLSDGGGLYLLVRSNGTKLDWVAVDHFNTDQPHTHIMLRGVDDRGENLVIAREYIAHGIRARAVELATLDLGPRTDQEIEGRLRREIDAERLTSIDRRLIREMDVERVVTASERDTFHQSLRAGRLQKLAEMDLAEPIGGARWRLAEGMEDTLRGMGERVDIIRTIQRELSTRGLDRSASGPAIFADAGDGASAMVGRLVLRGLADEHRDRHYLLLDGVDGRTHYVDVGRGDAVPVLPEGAIVEIAARVAEVRQADRTIAEVAGANGGFYSVELHLRYDGSATQTFAEAHVRRLEAMRRAGAGVERAPDGRWRITPDHLQQVMAYETRRQRDQPIDVRLLSTAPIEHLPQTEAATWLDREIGSDHPVPVRDAGFGREVREALAARRQWLVEQELADVQGERVQLRANALVMLERRELACASQALEAELGKSFRDARIGDSVEGVLRRHVDLVSGRYALVERSREFSLVPWRPTLEKHLGRHIAGRMRDDGINWQFTRRRSGPEIS